MDTRVVAGKTILLNTATNCTFIASKLDEKVQTGTRDNDKHIEVAGQLSIPVVVDQEDLVHQSCVKFLYWYLTHYDGPPAMRGATMNEIYEQFLTTPDICG